MLKGHTGSLESCEFCVGAEAVQVVTCSSEDATVRLWDLRARRAVRCFTDATHASHAVWEANSIVLGGADGRVSLLDARAGSVVGPAPQLWGCKVGDEVVNQVHVAGELVYSCADDGRVVCVGLKSGKKRADAAAGPPAHESLCTGVASRPESKNEFVSVGTDCRLKQWSRTDKSRQLLKSCHFSPAAEEGGSMQLCNPPHLLSVACDPRGRVAAVAVGDGRVLLWELEKKKVAATLRRHTYSVAMVRWAAPQLLVSFGNDRRALLWRVEPRKAKATAGEPCAEMALESKPDWAAARSDLMLVAAGKVVHLLPIE